jgi:hypothetical protein
MGRRSHCALLSVVVIALASAGCGGGETSRTGRTVTFRGGGTFPPSTIVGTYSARGCTADARKVAEGARRYYAHTNGAPGPADLYYFDLRFAYAQFEADGCTSDQLGRAMEQRLSARQRTFLLHNVAGDLSRAFHTALQSE